MSVSAKESKGEVDVKRWLQTNNIVFESEKTFAGCRFRRVLRFDFYIPAFKLCIEFDGKQHFLGWSDDPSNLELIRKKDNIKNQYCQSRGIRLLRIPYWCKSNIGEILENCFGNLVVI